MKNIFKLILLLTLLPLQVFGQGFTPGIQDEGGTLSYPSYNLNCTGEGITCSHSGTTGTINVDGSDLTPYAKLDGTNQPFTGDITVSKSLPKLIATDTGLASSTWLEKMTTLDGSRLISQNRLYSIPNGLTLAGATYGSGLSYTSTGALSVSFWWKTSNAGDSYFIGNSTASSDFRWGSGVLSFQDEAAGLARYWSATSFNNNTWRHIVLTISSDRATVKAYVNGALATQTQAGTVGGNFIINRIFATNGNTTGSFDDFRILTTELSLAQVQAIYNSGAPVETSDMTNMHAYYKLNETSGTSVADSSGNARTVTLTGGTPVWSTGIVATTPNPLTDVPVLSLVNNTTTGSYGTLQLGYRSGSAGTSNIYEGLTHRFQRLGSTVLSLDGSQVIAGHGNTDSRGGSKIFGSNNTALNSGGSELYNTILIGSGNQADNQRSGAFGVDNTVTGNASFAFGYALRPGSQSIYLGSNLTTVAANQIRIGLNNSRLMIIDTNGFVGLGDSAVAPNYLLDMVYGASGGAITQRIKTSTANQAASLMLDGHATGSANIYFYKGGGPNWRLYQDGSNDFNFYTFGSAPNASSLKLNYTTHAATFAGTVTSASRFIGTGATLTGNNSATVGSFAQPSAGTAITTPYPAFELVNTDATANNFVTFSFADAVSGASYALIGGQITDHANNYGNLNFWTRGANTAAIRLTLNDASGASATSNFINSTNTFPSTLTAETSGALFNYTTAGSSAQSIRAVKAILSAGYTGSSQTAVFRSENNVAGTGSAISTGGTTANMGLSSNALATTTGLNIGTHGYASGGNANIGMIGLAPSGKNSSSNIGVMGYAYNTGTGTVTQTGGLFRIGNGAVTLNTDFASAALIADNTDTTDPILLARDNGATVFSIIDGGTVNTKDVYPLTDDTHYLGKNDDDSPKAWKGIILKDQTTGTYYKLQIDSGVVTLIDLTD
jgi:hypothetical protein